MYKKYSYFYNKCKLITFDEKKSHESFKKIASWHFFIFLRFPKMLDF